MTNSSREGRNQSVNSPRLAFCAASAAGCSASARAAVLAAPEPIAVPVPPSQRERFGQLPSERPFICRPGLKEVPAVLPARDNIENNSARRSRIANAEPRQGYRGVRRGIAFAK